MKLTNKPWFPSLVFFLALCLFGAFLRCHEVPEAKAGPAGDKALVEMYSVFATIAVEEAKQTIILNRQTIALEKIAQELARIRKQH